MRALFGAAVVLSAGAATADETRPPSTPVDWGLVVTETTGNDIRQYIPTAKAQRIPAPGPWTCELSPIRVKVYKTTATETVVLQCVAGDARAEVPLVCVRRPTPKPPSSDQHWQVGEHAGMNLGGANDKDSRTVFRLSCDINPRWAL